jgi:hypothetical protein
MSWPTPPTSKPRVFPNAPTHDPAFASMEEIRETLGNWRNIFAFVTFLWKKHCKDFEGRSCLDMQKRHIEKYYYGHLKEKMLKAPPTLEAILNDLGNFARSRNSSLSYEFTQWIQSLSDLNFRMVALQSKKSRKSRKSRKSKSRKSRKSRK